LFQSGALKKKDAAYDFIAIDKDKKRFLVFIKYYRQLRPPLSYFKRAFVSTLFELNDENSAAIIITSGLIEGMRKYYDDVPIIILDGNDLLELSADNIDRREKLLQILPEGIEFERKEKHSIQAQIQRANENRNKKTNEKLQHRGQDLIQRLKECPPGKGHFPEYEKTCTEAIKYMFDNDLIGWWTQQSSNDGLNRYDLLCRIRSKNEFWKMLLTDFNSRFILFEFKNYNKEITPHEIYTTERYLYQTANRNMAIVFSRKGPTENCYKASTGALREYGKLVIHISDDDLIEVLQRMDKGDDPNELLFKKHDEIMISISR